MSTFGVTGCYDVMFLYSGNLNVPENLRNYTKDVFVKNASAALDSNQLSTHEYFSESKVIGAIEFHQGSLNSRSSATSYALSNTISTLVEVRGVGIGKTSFKRRTNAAFLVASSYLKTAYNRVNEVKEVLAEASRKREEAVVSSKTEVTEKPLTFIDLEKEEKIDIPVRIKEAWFAKSVLTRKRPTAYLILPEYKTLAEKLRILGVHVDSLEMAKSLETETYRVTDYLQDAEKFEEVNRQEVSTTLSTTTREFPKGTFIVQMDQPRANLAIEVLEPEASNSFISFDVLHTSMNAELPVYRYLKKEAL